MGMRAIFASFDNFMVMFVAMFAVTWSTVFMPLLGGPLHVYEARAIGMGWESLRTGEAATIGEALERAASLPAEAVFPSASAHEVPARLTNVALAPSELELLGGPEVELTVPRRSPNTSPRLTNMSAAVEPREPGIDCVRTKRARCEAPMTGGAVAASA